MKQKSFKVTPGEKLNPKLKKEIQDLRGLIWERIPQINNPRFEMTQCKDRPAVIILDVKTGIMSEPISLCDLRGAVQIINELKL